MPNEIYTFGLNAEFLSRLHQCGARFLIIGGTAVRFHCPDREANDLDIMIEPTTENARLIIAELERSKVTCHFTAHDLAQPDQHIPFKEKNYYLDILTPKEGCQFSGLLTSACDAVVEYRGLQVPVKVASKETLIALSMQCESSDKRTRDIQLLQAAVRPVR